MLDHHVAGNHIEASVAKRQIIGGTERPFLDVPMLLEVVKIHIAAHHRLRCRNQSVLNWLKVFPKESPPASQIEPARLATYILLERGSVDPLIPDQIWKDPFHQPPRHAAAEHGVPQAPEAHRAPRPRITILMVWNRIRKSKPIDAFLM